MNIFFKINGKVVTPMLNGSILPGVTRRTCVELCQSWGMEVEERKKGLQAIVIRERCAPYFTRLEDVSSVQARLPKPHGRSRSDSPSRSTPQRQRRCA